MKTDYLDPNHMRIHLETDIRVLNGRIDELTRILNQQNKVGLINRDVLSRVRDLTLTRDRLASTLETIKQGKLDG
jgi:hypothetical protein